MPRPPEKLDPQDVERDVKKSVGEAHSKRLTPAGQLHTINGNISGIVVAGICVCVYERGRGMVQEMDEFNA